MSIFKMFLPSHFSSHSLEYQKKTKHIIIVLLIVMFIVNLNGVIMLLTGGHYTILSYILFLTNVPAIIALSMIKKSKFVIASWISQFYVFLIIASVIILLGMDNYLAMYRAGYYVLIFLIISIMITFKKSQIYVAGVISFIVMTIITIKNWHTMLNKGGSSLIVAFIAIYTTILMAIVIVANNITFSHEIIDEAENEKDLNMQRYQKLKEVVDSSKETLNNVNDTIKLSLKEGLEEINKSFMEIEDIKNEIVKLAENSRLLRTSSSQIETNVESFTHSVEKQTAEVNEIGFSVGEMTGSISSIRTVVNKRREELMLLDKSVNSSKQHLEDIENMISEFIKKMGKLKSFSKNIIDIAQQTNVLSLNASIEATKAGEKGKGFSIVAHEIRTLSKNTDKYANEINKELKSNIKMTEELNKKVSSLLKVMENFYAETKNSYDSFVEIAKGVNEIGAGIEDIKNASEELQIMTDEINNHSKDIMHEVRENYVNVDALNKAIEIIKNNTYEIYEKFKRLTDIFNKIQKDELLNIKAIEDFGTQVVSLD